MDLDFLLRVVDLERDLLRLTGDFVLDRFLLPRDGDLDFRFRAGDLDLFRLIGDLDFVCRLRLDDLDLERFLRTGDFDFEFLLREEDLDSECFFLAGDNDVDSCLNFNKLDLILLDDFVSSCLALPGEDALELSDPSRSQESSLLFDSEISRWP